MNHIRAALLRGKKVGKEKGKKTLPAVLSKILNDDSKKPNATLNDLSKISQSART